jgi:hypothetical protein
MNNSNDRSNDKRVTSTTDRNAAGKSAGANIDASGKDASFGKSQTREPAGPSTISGGSASAPGKHDGASSTKR